MTEMFPPDSHPGEALNPNPGNLCGSCNVRPVQTEYPTLLCYECREQYVRYPIPKWIWLFGAGILLVMIISFTTVPRYFNAAIHQGRGKKAMDAHKYVTAKREFMEVRTLVPDDKTNNARLLMAACYDMDIPLAFQVYEKLKGEKFEDMTLFGKVEDAMNFFFESIGQDTVIYARVTAAASDSVPGLMRYAASLDSLPEQEQAKARLMVANRLYELDALDATEAELKKIFEISPASYLGLFLKASVKKQQGKYDEALAVCDQILERNREDVRAISQKARIEMKRRDYTKAAVYVNQADRIDPASTYTEEAKALLAFFTGKKNESLKLLAAIREQEQIDGDTSISTRIEDVITGKKPY